MIIDFEMLKRFNRTIDEILFKELALGAENAHIQCKAFLDEAPEGINRRNDLSGKLVELEAARLEVQKVGKHCFLWRLSRPDSMSATRIHRDRSNCNRRIPTRSSHDTDIKL